MLFGCGFTPTIQTGPQSWQLQVETGYAIVPAGFAGPHLERRALELCPRGFLRTAEAYLPGDDGPGWDGLRVVWDITCL